MKYTEINYKAVYNALQGSTGVSVSNYEKNEDELFLFRRRPLKGLVYTGKNKTFLLKFWDGTESVLTMMDNGTEKGAVINNNIDEDSLLSLSRKVDEPITYTPVPGANILGYSGIQEIFVEKNHFVIRYENNSQTERYYCD